MLASGETSLEARVGRMEAQLQIEAVLADYAMGIDERDAARWLSAFHDDAVFDVDYPQAVLRGHEEIENWVREAWRFQTISHLTGNHHITLVDETSGHGLGRGLGLFKIEDGSVVLATARLEDRYEKRAGVWKLSFRRVTLISSFRLEGAAALILNGRVVDHDLAA